MPFVQLYHIEGRNWGKKLVSNVTQRLDEKSDQVSGLETGKSRLRVHLLTVGYNYFHLIDSAKVVLKVNIAK